MMASKRRRNRNEEENGQGDCWDTMEGHGHGHAAIGDRGTLVGTRKLEMMISMCSMAHWLQWADKKRPTCWGGVLLSCPSARRAGAGQDRKGSRVVVVDVDVVVGGSGHGTGAWPAKQDKPAVLELEVCDCSN